MRLLVDSDLFCKLGVGGILFDALTALETRIEECARLPALPHMLRRGSLTRRYGVKECAELIPIAEKMQPAGTPEAIWLDRLTPIHEVDPGEAQLFALAAQEDLFVATGDKRALNGLKNVDGYAEALSGHIIVLEGILLVLCDRLGPDILRRRVEPLMKNDKMVEICFSDANDDPRAAVESYLRSLADEVAPLTLWSITPGDAA